MMLARMALWLAGMTGWLRAPLPVLLALGQRAGGGAVVRAVQWSLGGLGAWLQQGPARLLPRLRSRMRQQADINTAAAHHAAPEGVAGHGMAVPVFAMKTAHHAAPRNSWKTEVRA
jgi:hypothetical protein